MILCVSICLYFGLILVSERRKPPFLSNSRILSGLLDLGTNKQIFYLLSVKCIALLFMLRSYIFKLFSVCLFNFVAMKFCWSPIRWRGEGTGDIPFRGLLGTLSWSSLWLDFLFKLKKFSTLCRLKPYSLDSFLLCLLYQFALVRTFG